MVAPLLSSPSTSGLTPYPNKPPGPVNSPKDNIQVEPNSGLTHDPNKPPSPSNEPKDPCDFPDRDWAQVSQSHCNTDDAPNITDFPDIQAQSTTETSSPSLLLDDDLFD